MSEENSILRGIEQFQSVASGHIEALRYAKEIGLTLDNLENWPDFQELVACVSPHDHAYTVVDSWSELHIWCHRLECACGAWEVTRRDIRNGG